MRPAVLLLAFAVCKAPAPERGAAPSPEPVAAVPPADPVASMEQAAARQARRGLFRESTASYRRLAALQPASPSLCRWQLVVVHNAMAAGDKREWVEELQRLAAVDRAMSAPTSAAPADAWLACHRAYRDLLAETVFVLNKELTMGVCTAYTARSWPFLETLFHQFLADFPRDPQAPEARRLLERLLGLERGEPRWQIDHGRD